MTTFILTGPTSFIGLALIRELKKRDNTSVIALVRPNSTRRKLLDDKEITVIEADMEDLKKSDNSIIGQADYFIHVGWSSNFDNPRYNLEGQLTNVGYLLDAIRLAYSCKCHTFVGIGSQAECGVVNEAITELTAENPLTAYAEAKCECYRKGLELANSFGMKFCWPRLLSAYGPYDRPATMISSCVRAGLSKQRMDFSGCGQQWDYIYVDDVARALIAIAINGINGVKYPVSSGKKRELCEYIEIISNETGYPELLEGIGKRPYINGQPMFLLGDISALTKDTGFIPQIEFEEGIKEYIQFCRDSME